MTMQIVFEFESEFVVDSQWEGIVLSLVIMPEFELEFEFEFEFEFE